MNGFVLRRGLAASATKAICRTPHSSRGALAGFWLPWQNDKLVAREDEVTGRPKFDVSLRRSFSTFKDTVEVTKTKTEALGDEKEGSAEDSAEPISCHGAGEEPEKGSKRDKERHMMELQHWIRLHHKHAQYYKALQSSLELLECSEDLYGSENKNHPVIASAHNNVGLMNKMLGKYDDARTHYHTALRMYTEVVGTDHASYAAALNNLGNLDKAQATTPLSEEGESNENELSSLDRVAYLESAIEYFDEAYRIRKAELGDFHAHTVTSRTNLGSALAAFVLEQQASLLRAYHQRRQADEKGATEDQASPLPKMSKFTRRRWEAAEEHLREALQTAIDNPRGREVADPTTHVQPTNTATTLQTIPKKYRSKKSKQSRKIQPKPNEAKEQATIPSEPEQVDAFTSPIRTASAAAAAQNLAVFLKSRADLQRATPSTADATTTTDPEELFFEARSLYLQALRVREKLLHAAHPDTVATKFSLAELYTSVGNEQAANDLRQEILNAYSVEEREDEEEEEAEEAAATDKNNTSDPKDGGSSQ